MIVSIGLDVCSIERMRRAVARHGDRFAARICSPSELAGVGGRDVATFVAARFAVKEAFAKCLDGARGVGWHEVEVHSAASGRPSLTLSGNALISASKLGATRWHVTITHDAGIASAVVILEGPA